MLNEVRFIGRLVKDPETRTIGNGDIVCNFAVAVGYKDKVQFPRFKAWGKQAQFINQYVKKGATVYIETSWTPEPYEDKNGVKRTDDTFTVYKVILLDKNNQNHQNQNGQDDFFANLSNIEISEDDLPY